MFAPKYRREEILATNATLGSELVLTIPRAQRRLEFILLSVSYTTATLADPTHESHANMVERVQLMVDDGALRPAVDCRGVDLITLWDQWGLNPFRVNQLYMGTTSTGTGGVLSVSLNYMVPIRHPLIEDPSGIFTGVPMWKLGSNAELRIKLQTNPAMIAGTFSVNAAGIRVTATTYYREDVTDIYLPSQVAGFSMGAIPNNSRFEWNFPQGGYLTTWGLTTYNGPTTRGSLHSPSGMIELTYGTKQMDVSTDRGLEYRRDAFQDSQGVANFNVFVYGDDLLYDLPGVGGFHPRTALDLDPVPKGDLLKFAVSQTASSGTLQARGVTHKFLANPNEFLRAI